MVRTDICLTYIWIFRKIGWKLNNKSVYIWKNFSYFDILENELLYLNHSYNYFHCFVKYTHSNGNYNRDFSGTLRQITLLFYTNPQCIFISKWGDALLECRLLLLKALTNARNALDPLVVPCANSLRAHINLRFLTLLQCLS